MKHAYFARITLLKRWCNDRFIFFGKNISCANKGNKICQHSWIWGEAVKQLWWVTLNNSVCHFGIHLSPDVHSQTLFHKRQQHFLMAGVSSAVQCPLSDHNSDLEKKRGHSEWVWIWCIFANTQLKIKPFRQTEDSSAAVQLHLCIHPKNTQAN